MNVLLLVGHPREPSLCGALADAFADGARHAGATIREVRIAGLDFDPDVHAPSPADQPLEPDLARLRDDLVWADHLVFVFPTWWGTFPARLKALLDRLLAPGFAFRYLGNGRYRPLLGGRTVQLLTTMDTPGWVYRWIYRAPGLQALSRATLGFCGLRTVRLDIFGPVIRSDTHQRGAWLAEAVRLGERLRDGPLSGRQRATDRVRAWLAALRLQFYPMTWIGYTVGALAATATPDPARYWSGLLALFLLEAATVFSNEYWDLPTDRVNHLAGPFNGGSRVLVDGRIGQRALHRAATGMLAGSAAIVAWLALGPARVGPEAVGWLTALAVLAVGYTVPPLRLVYRTLGELDVAFTHSAGVLVGGYLLQGGSLGDPAPWLLSLPLMLAVLPAITLSHIPDSPADAAAGKRTIAVRFGARRAQAFALVATALAAALGVGGWLAGVAGHAYGPWMLAAAAHGGWLAAAIWRYRESRQPVGRIDGLLVIALSFILWFGLVPLLRLW